MLGIAPILRLRPAGVRTTGTSRRARFRPPSRPIHRGHTRRLVPNAAPPFSADQNRSGVRRTPISSIAGWALLPPLRFPDRRPHAPLRRRAGRSLATSLPAARGRGRSARGTGAGPPVTYAAGPRGVGRGDTRATAHAGGPRWTGVASRMRSAGSKRATACCSCSRSPARSRRIPQRRRSLRDGETPRRAGPS